MVTVPTSCRDHYKRCEARFQKACVGPSLTTQAERLAKAWNREEARFRHDYNDKLLNGLVFVMLAAIILFRFVVRISLLESAGWVGFVFLQVFLPILSASLLACARDFSDLMSSGGI